MAGDDVAGLGAAADPLAQMVEVEFFRELFGHDVLLRARAGSMALPWPPTLLGSLFPALKVIPSV